MHCCDLCKKQIILWFSKLHLPCIIFLSNLEIWSLLLYLFISGREVEWEKLLLYCSLEVELELLEMTGAWERPFENVSFSQPVCQPAAWAVLGGWGRWEISQRHRGPSWRPTETQERNVQFLNSFSFKNASIQIKYLFATVYDISGKSGKSRNCMDINNNSPGLASFVCGQLAWNTKIWKYDWGSEVGASQCLLPRSRDWITLIRAVTGVVSSKAPAPSKHTPGQHHLSEWRGWFFVLFLLKWRHWGVRLGSSAPHESISLHSVPNQPTDKPKSKRDALYAREASRMLASAFTASN